MRISRLLVVSAISLTAVAVPLAGAAVATTPNPVVSTTGVPSPLTANVTSCASVGGEGYGQVVHVTGPLTPPVGTGSLELTTTDEEQIGEYWSTPIYASTLNALSLGYLTQAGVTAVLEVDLNATASSEDIAQLALGSSASWATADLFSSQLTTFHLSETGISDQMTQSWSQFLSGNPGSQIDSANIILSACTGSQTDAKPSAQPVHIYVDDLQIGVASTATTYDFEAAPTAAKLTLAVPATATAGSTITILGSLDNGSAGLPGQRVTLLAKTAGSSIWKTAAVVTSGANGALSSKQKITAATAYAWSFEGNEDIAGATSSAKTVTLATRSTITINVIERRLANHKPVALFGQIAPAKSGITITVYDRVGKHVRKLGRAKTKSRGTWGFSHALTKGTHRLYAKVAAYPGHLSGTSKLVKVHAKS